MRSAYRRVSIASSEKEREREREKIDSTGHKYEFTYSRAKAHGLKFIDLKPRSDVIGRD